MTGLGQTRKSALVTAMSAFSPTATKLRTSREVRFVPNPEVAASLDHLVDDGSKVAGTLAKRMAKEYFVPSLKPASSKPTRSAAILSFAASCDASAHAISSVSRRSFRLSLMK